MALEERQSSPEEEDVREIMEQLSISREEAIAWRQSFANKFYGDRTVVYDFLRQHNPKVREMEQDRSYQEKSVRFAERMGVTLPEARAHVILNDLLAKGAMKLYLKDKPKTAIADVQEMLGVTVPIPQEVLDALRIETV